MEAQLRPILNEEGLASIVQSLPMGRTIEIVVERDGRRITLPVTLSKGRTEYEFFKPATPDLQTGQPAGSGSG